MGLVKNIFYKLAKKQYLSKFKNQTIFPYYHLVRENQVPHIEYLYQFKNKQQFIDDLDVLTSQYQSLHPKELLSNKIFNNKFLLTFDDGLQEVYSVIYPILKERNISAIFFINPDFIDNQEGNYKHYLSIILSHLSKNHYDNKTLEQVSSILGFSYQSEIAFKKKLLRVRYSQKKQIIKVLDFLKIDITKYLKDQPIYLSKNQIQEMMKDGFYFGGHTLSHPRLEELSIENQKTEIIASLNWLKTHFNIDYSFFSFPFSDKLITKEIITSLVAYDRKIRIFGNAGMKKDIDDRIIQRFSVENPTKEIEKIIIVENMYKYFNMITGKYNIKRK